jgi:hypothetical protein
MQKWLDHDKRISTWRAREYDDGEPEGEAPNDLLADLWYLLLTLDVYGSRAARAHAREAFDELSECIFKDAPLDRTAFEAFQRQMRTDLGVPDTPPPGS